MRRIVLVLSVILILLIIACAIAFYYFRLDEPEFSPKFCRIDEDCNFCTGKSSISYGDCVEGACVYSNSVICVAPVRGQEASCIQPEQGPAYCFSQ